MSLDAYNLNKLPINYSSVIDDNQDELNDDGLSKINENTIDIQDNGIERVMNPNQESHPVSQNYKFENISNLSDIQENINYLNKKNSDMSDIGS